MRKVGFGAIHLDFTPPPAPKCVHCRKPKRQHKDKTFECPVGMKGRSGHNMFGPKVYTASVRARRAGMDGKQERDYGAQHRNPEKRG